MSTYPGGKGSQYRNIINQIPPHRVYLEGFLGGGAVMRMKRPADVNIGLERNFDVLRQFLANTATNSDGCRFASPEMMLSARRLLVCADALSFLAHAPVASDWFVYLDPPYVLSTRSSRQLYGDNEMTDLQHICLLRIITRLPCYVAISGYVSEMYMTYLHDWRCISYDAMTRGGTVRREYLWMNYPEPLELHQYDFLGENFREREKLNRQKQRLLRKLARMPILQQRMLMQALLETRQK